MRLNVQTDYALRVLMYLAINRDRLCTISEIAKHYQISKNHLVKVTAGLASDGFIDTVRGRSGGLRLSRPAAEITVGNVVRETESDFELAECLGDDSQCVAGAGCRLRGILNDAMTAFLGVLDDCTLNDLTGRNPRLRTALLVAIQ